MEVSGVGSVVKWRDPPDMVVLLYPDILSKFVLGVPRVELLDGSATC